MMANKTPETNCRPASPVDARLQFGRAVSLDLAFSAAAVQLCVRHIMTSMRRLKQIESDIRRITSLVTEHGDEAILECAIDGTASAIPGAFVDSLDRTDGTGEASAALHELLVEYANIMGQLKDGIVPRAITLRFSSGKTTISAKWPS